MDTVTAVDVVPHAPSIWNATAVPPPALLPLRGELQVDCAIVGGGFTGLNAALHLSRRGAQACILEANDAGWGASGRNGGMAVLRYKSGWAALARQFGHERTRLLHRLVLDAVDALEQNVADFRLDGGFSRCGHITAAYTRQDARALRDDVDWLAAEAGDRHPRYLPPDEAARLIGSRTYAGGYLDSRAAGIHPLGYARELAAALAATGVPIHVSTPVVSIREDAQGCVLETPDARVRAATVIVASNAYTELFPLPAGLKRRIVPVATSVVATRTLPDDLYASMFTEGHLVTDTRHLVNYFRRVPGQRVLFGGRGSLTGHETPEIYRNLVTGLRRLFPQLRDVPIEHQWSGKVAVTLDDFPHVVRHSPRVVFAAGYGGRGVALTHLLGRMAAEMALGATVQCGPMQDGMPELPFHSWRLPVMNLMAAYYKLRDQLRL